MARRRKFGEDLTYAEAHRNNLPELYGRIGHRIDMADRDWTEFCHHCKRPILIIEEVMDRGQNLYDKTTTVTRGLASMAGIPAILIAPRLSRPQEVQDEINWLNERIRKLEGDHPIALITARRLYPEPGPLLCYSPEKWWPEIYMHHRNHHRVCAKARRCELPVKLRPLAEAKERSELWTDAMDQLGMF